MKNPAYNSEAATVAVFKVTPEGHFNVELWNGDPIPEELHEAVVNAGFSPLAGGGRSYLWERGDAAQGAVLLSQMQILQLV